MSIYSQKKKITNRVNECLYEGNIFPYRNTCVRLPRIILDQISVTWAYRTIHIFYLVIPEKKCIGSEMKVLISFFVSSDSWDEIRWKALFLPGSLVMGRRYEFNLRFGWKLSHNLLLCAASGLWQSWLSTASYRLWTLAVVHRLQTYPFHHHFPTSWPDK